MRSLRAALPLLVVLLHPLPAQAQAAPPREGSPSVSVGGVPALRQGDRGSIEGSPNVFIDGRPAATLGGRTGCGGTLAGGAGHVFVNGRPLATADSGATPCPPR